MQPKVAAHARGCRGAEFTCIDCSRNFTVQTVQVCYLCNAIDDVVLRTGAASHSVVSLRI